MTMSEFALRPTTKSARHQLIVDLVSHHEVHSQGELAVLLAEKPVIDSAGEMGKNLWKSMQLEKFCVCWVDKKNYLVRILPLRLIARFRKLRCNRFPLAKKVRAVAFADLLKEVGH